MFKFKYVIIPILVIFLIIEIILLLPADKFIMINSTIKAIHICADNNPLKNTICSIEITYTYNNVPHNNYIYPSDSSNNYTIGQIIPVYIQEKSPQYVYLDVIQQKNKTSLYVILFITILLIAFFAIKK
jgi:hypothetical protein